MKTENGKASISLVQYLPPYNGAPLVENRICEQILNYIIVVANRHL